MRDPSEAANPAGAPADHAEALADELERIAMGTVGLTTRSLVEAHPGFELTFPQWRALIVLGEAPDGARIGEIAVRVGTTLPATGRLLRRLERRGLTALAVDPDDRRATRARLTDRGRTVRGAILDHRRAVLREVAAAVADPSQPDLLAGLRAIASALERNA